MGVEVKGFNNCGARKSHIYGVKSDRKSIVSAEACPASIAGRWTEIYLTVMSLDYESGETEQKAPVSDEIEVRIHGVTVPKLIDAMLRDPTLFKYLSSAVDHLRANPGDFR